MHNAMKKLSTFAAWALAFAGAAQNVLVTEVIVANGEKFMDPDPATIGIYSDRTLTYTVFDSVRTNSVQALRWHNGKIYLASQDSLVVYDGATLQRDTTVYFKNVGHLYVDNEVIALGKLFGDTSVPAFMVLNASDYGVRLFDTSTYVPQVTGAARVGDSLFLSYNIKGTVDQWPPYGVYKDSIGALLRVNLQSNSLEANLVLDTNAAGLRDIVRTGDSIIAGPAVEANTVVVFHAARNTFGVFPDPTNIQRLILKASNRIYTLGRMGGKSRVFAHHLDTDMVSVVYTFPTYFPRIAAVAVDTLKAKVYFTVTDYATYGRLYVGDFGDSVVTDSVDVGISPEALAIRYRVMTLSAPMPEAAVLQAYPNPAVDYVTVELPEGGARNVTVFDAEGRRVMHRTDVSGAYLRLDVRHWPSGTYWVRITDRNGRPFTASWNRR